jgi:hypothetical protein
MPCGYVMRSALPLPASSCKRFLLRQTTRGLMASRGIDPVWPAVSSHTARRQIARGISMSVQRCFVVGVCRLSL